MRRVCALRSYKIDTTAPEKEPEILKTDINRIRKANFIFPEDEQVETALVR